MKPRKAPTILDIAKAAGVSKSAVSRALQGQGEVSPDTREKIERAAVELGYVANAMARGLRSQTQTIGVVLRDVTRPFYAWLQAGMQQAAENRGYQVVTMTSAGELEVEDALKALRSLISLQVDGLVIASARLPSDEIVPYMDRIPIVVAGRRETSRGITSVFCDDVDGGQLLADHLLALGHRRVAIPLVDESYSRSQHARGQAMAERIRSAGGEPVVWNVPSDADTAQAASALLSDSAVTAIMAPTDVAAVEVLDLLRERYGDNPPIAVTGYDGIGPLATPYLGLTTFRQPVREIGRVAIDLLVDRIEGLSDQDRLVALRGTLVEGRTATAVAQVQGARGN